MPSKSTIPVSLSLSSDYTACRGDSIRSWNMKERVTLAQRNTPQFTAIVLHAVAVIQARAPRFNLAAHG
jgi:hypothetical protein